MAKRDSIELANNYIYTFKIVHKTEQKNSHFYITGAFYIFVLLTNVIMIGLTAIVTCYCNVTFLGLYNTTMQHFN